MEAAPHSACFGARRGRVINYLEESGSRIFIAPERRITGRVLKIQILGPYPLRFNRSAIRPRNLYFSKLPGCVHGSGTWIPLGKKPCMIQSLHFTAEGSQWRARVGQRLVPRCPGETGLASRPPHSQAGLSSLASLLRCRFGMGPKGQWCCPRPTGTEAMCGYTAAVCGPPLQPQCPAVPGTEPVFTESLFYC